MTYCGPSNPTGYDHKVQESSNCSVCKTGCLNWYSVYTRIVKKWTLLPLKERTGLAGQTKTKELPSSMFLYKIPGEGVAQIRGRFP